jgi:hypothetical protein
VPLNPRAIRPPSLDKYNQMASTIDAPMRRIHGRKSRRIVASAPVALTTVVVPAVWSPDLVRAGGTPRISSFVARQPLAQVQYRAQLRLSHCEAGCETGSGDTLATAAWRRWAPRLSACLQWMLWVTRYSSLVGT